jgi:hypothetical protein
VIDRGELGHVRVGKRRVRVRQSQLDCFLAAGESSPQSVEADPWRSVSEAASDLVAAVRARDSEALERVLTNLGEAAQRIAQAVEPDAPQPDSEPE